MKINSQVNKIRLDVEFYYKLYIHDEQYHLWLRMDDYCGWSLPDFRICGEHGPWELVALFPLSTLFSESAVKDILAQWVVFERPYKFQVKVEDIERYSMEYIVDEAKQEDREWKYRREQEEQNRRDKFDKALVEGVLT